MKTANVELTMEQMQAIAVAIDIALKDRGIQVVKHLAPVLELLDESINDLNLENNVSDD